MNYRPVSAVKFLVGVFLFLSLLSKAYSSQLDFSLDDNWSQLVSELQVATLPEPTPELLKFSYLKMRQFLEFRKGTLSQSKAHSNFHLWIDQNFEILMEKTFSRLLSQKKIKYITPELAHKISLNQYLCDPRFSCSSRPLNGCRRLKGFYIHILDTIFMSPELDQEAFAKALFHEMIHAYQYAYRFPLDLDLLAKLAKSGHMEENKTLDFLGFAYEAQANWYEIVATNNQAWSDVAKTSDQVTETTKALVNTAVEIASLPFYALKEIFTGNRKRQLSGEAALSEKLPFVDLSYHGYSFQYPAQKKTAYVLREPVVLKDTSTLLAGNVDLNLHKMFSKALECTYFGKLPFLFQDNADDQIVLKQMSEQYYKKILVGNATSFDPKLSKAYPILKNYSEGTTLTNNSCKPVLDKMEKSKSPFIYWMSEDSKSFQSCESYKSILQNNEQNEVLKRYYKFSEDSPFNLEKSGTEGGGGGFVLSPSLGFMPQLELLPLKMEVQNEN